ncbi:MAG TPA: hypothetical protein PLY41_09300 [Acetomicrobium sp.]|nr:hypothetical protein [Acetomicrobium sp.]
MDIQDRNMMRAERQITQHIRFGYALPFGTLLPLVATSYMLGTLSEIASVSKREVIR